MMQKSKFRKMDPYDWFCGPYDNEYIYSLKTNLIILQFSLLNKIFRQENQTKIEQCGSV